MTAASSALGGGLALVRNRRWDYLAADAPARAVYAEIFNGRTGPSNHVRYVFLDDQTGSGFKFGTWARRCVDRADPAIRRRPAPEPN